MQELRKQRKRPNCYDDVCLSPAYSFVQTAKAAEKRIAELSAIFKRIYEDNVTMQILNERFKEFSADYETEQKELKERTADLQSEFSRILEATRNAGKSSAGRKSKSIIISSAR